jgi:putative cell wall-binding protein
VSIPGATSNGDTFKIQIDDSDVGINCLAVGDSIGFGSVPTVANTTVTSTVTFTATLTTSAGCPAGTNDILTLKAVAAATDAGPIALTLSGVTYNVGSAAAVGKITYQVNDAGGYINTFSNATVSAVRAASSNSAVLVPTSATTAISNVVIGEQRAGAIPAGPVCVQLLNPPAGTTFAVAPVPTVTAAGGTGAGVPTVVTPTATTMSFTTTLSTAATTYTLAGLQLTTGANTGPVNAKVGFSCGGTEISQNLRLATVGTINRIQGSDRFATARLIATSTDLGTAFGDLKTKTVVIARGDNFPDALAASYLAGRNGVPIFLTNTASVPNDTVQALKYHGVTNVVLVGGTTAISTGVEAFLDALPTYDFGSNTANAATIAVTRIQGSDRYATARAVAEFPGLGLTSSADGGLNAVCNPLKTAIVASGENFPDALSAGGLAYNGLEGGCGSGGLPLLLTNPTGLNPATVAALTNLNIKQVILMGGTGAVNDATKAGIESLGITVVRVFGPTRQDTAVALANTVLGTTFGGWTDEGSGAFLLSRPDTFPDALAASSLSGRSLSPIYLSESPSNLGTVASGGIISWPAYYDTGELLGGTEALSATVAGQVGFTIAAQPDPGP